MASVHLLDLHDILSDKVVCPICFETFTDPKALSCLHTFCASCVKKMTKKHQVTCPTCRKLTKEQDIVNDFKTSELVDIYLKQTTGTLNIDIVCDLCKNTAAQFLCNDCKKYLCSSCQMSHRVFTNCQECHSENLGGKIKDIVKHLDAKQKDFSEEKQRFINTEKQSVAENMKSAEKCLNALENCETTTFQEMKRHFDEQKVNIYTILDDKNLLIKNKRSELVKRTEASIAHIEQVKNSAQVLLADHLSLQDELEQELDQLKNESFDESFHVTYIVKNKDTVAFDKRKSITVENYNQPDSGIDKPQIIPNIFSGLMKDLKACSLLVKKTISEETIRQIQFVSGEIWALMDAHIVTFSLDGLKRRTFSPGFYGARDMCVSGSGHAIIATYYSGLFQIASTGFTRKIDAGKYWSVTYGDPQSIWAVKEEEGGKGIWIIKYDVNKNTATMTKKLQTKTSILPDDAQLVKRRGPSHWWVTCGVVGKSFYMCSKSKSTIDVIDTEDGRLLTVHCYSENASFSKLLIDSYDRSLLLVDEKSKCLNIFEPVTQTWTKIDIYPLYLNVDINAITADSRGQIWLSSNNKLLQCSLRYLPKNDPLMCKVHVGIIVLYLLYHCIIMYYSYFEALFSLIN